MSAWPSYYLNCGERYGYPVSIIALVASLGCSRSYSELAGSVDAVAGSAKEGRRREGWREKKREKESAGRKIARLWLRVTGWRGSPRPRPSFTATARRSCRVLMRYTIAWWLLNKKYESKMAAFAAIRHWEAWFVPKPELCAGVKIGPPCTRRGAGKERAAVPGARGGETRGPR